MVFSIVFFLNLFIYLFIYFYLLFRIYIIEIGGQGRGLRPSLFVRRRLGVRLVFHSAFLSPDCKLVFKVRDV